MPFTPFHLGPGLIVKAVVGRRFSLLAFGIAQVVMDVEPLLAMWFGWEVLHGPTHTYVAALLLGLALAWMMPVLAGPVLGRWNRELAALRLEWMIEPVSPHRTPILLGALTGTFSHVALDSIMHAEMAPLLPWSQANALFGSVSISALYDWCFWSGTAGLVLWGCLAVRRR